MPAIIVGALHAEIKVNGTALDATSLLGIHTEHSYNRPATCAITLNIDDPDVVPNVKVGDELAVAMAPFLQSAPKIPMFMGEVIGTEIDFDGVNTAFIIEGADRLHRLFRDDRSKPNKDVKVSELVSKIASTHGLSPEVTATSYIHPFLNQYNETDGDFVSRLATQAGMWLKVDDKKLVMAPLTQTEAPKLTLQYGVDLRTFNVRSTATSSLAAVEGRGWDPLQKKEVVGRATGTEANANLPVLKKAGEGKTVALRPGNQAALETTAKAIALLANESGHELSGTCYGAALSPGNFIDIKGVGAKFSGKYRVNRVRHRFDAAEGFMTEFWCGSPTTNSLATLVARTAEAGGRSTDAFTEPTTAIVTNNNDEEGKMGRVKVKFPQLDDAMESDWMRVVYPGAGAKRGLQVVPEVNDEVLVVFGGGDSRTGYVIGGLYNGKDAPPLPNDKTSRAVKQKGFYSRIGAFLLFDDDQKTIQLQTSDKNVDVVMKSGDGLTVTTKSGNVVTVKADGAVTVESQSGNIALKAAAGDLTIDAKNVTIKASVNLKLEGTASAEMKGATAKVEGTAAAELKGAMATVSASGITEVKGSIVKIN